MSIFDAAPSELYQTKMLRTFVDSLWKRYFWAIIRCKLIPNFLYLITAESYFAYYLFNQKGLKGIPVAERWSFTFECVYRHILVFLIFYHIFYEVLQSIRFRSEYFKEWQNTYQLASISTNLFLITYHVFDWQFLGQGIILLAFFAMLVLWIDFFQLLQIFNSFAFYTQLLRELAKELRAFVVLYCLMIFMFANLLSILSAEEIAAQIDG